MPTFVYSKQDFIAFVEKQVKDDQAVIFSSELSGQLSISENSGLKIQHVYAHDVFKDEGFLQVASGRSLSISFIIADKESLSDKATAALNNS